MVKDESGHVTLSCVARACQLSVSTVSIVLSEAPPAARRLGPPTDVHVRSLRRRCTQTIGVLAHHRPQPFCTSVVHGIEDGLPPAGDLSPLVNAQTGRRPFDSYLHRILRRRAEGVRGRGYRDLQLFTGLAGQPLRQSRKFTLASLHGREGRC